MQMVAILVRLMVSFDYEPMSLIVGHTYKFMMMSGEVIEGTVTDTHGAYETFHVTVGRARRQYYYWDVDYAWDNADDD